MRFWAVEESCGIADDREKLQYSENKIICRRTTAEKRGNTNEVWLLGKQ